MKIYDNLKIINEYIYNKAKVKLQEYKPVFQYIMNQIKQYKVISSKTKIFEIGTGCGYFQIMCAMSNLNSKGIDISPQLIRYSKSFAEKYNVKIDVKIGNIEDEKIGSSKYDVIIAQCVFEHVKLWQEGLIKIFKALKPKGLFYFISTNKFYPLNTEFKFPFYGYLPDKLRYKLRGWFCGEEPMKLLIDYNQFNYFKLYRFFRSLGYSEVLDIFDIRNIDYNNRLSSLKYAILNVGKHSKLLRKIFLIFYPLTIFVCIK